VPAQWPAEISTVPRDPSSPNTLVVTSLVDASPPAAQVTTTSTPRLRALLWAVGAVGLIAAIALLVRGGLSGIVRLLDIAGWRLLWLVPLHLVQLACFGAAWRCLLTRGKRPGLLYLTWGAIVRESVSGLLPVARIGGEVAGIRLLTRRSVSTAEAAASVAVELTLTMTAQLLFAATALALLATYPSVGPAIRIVAVGLLISVVVIAAFVATLRRWGRSAFAAAQRVINALVGRATDGATGGSDSADFHAALHSMYADPRALVGCTAWQLIGFFSGAPELWVTLRMLGHPTTVRGAIILEGLANAIQSAMFIVPAGLGTQEGAFLIFGATVGLSPQVALALSLARRARQLLLGVPGLCSWYWVEWRTRAAAAAAAAAVAA
jgi:putative membrane protein